jgi:glycosyltransferase involved in cell wall biosynthesis
MEKLGSKLMVLSLARHSFNTENKPVSYEPYVREMNLWCELYDQVDIYTIIHPFNKEQKHKFSEFKYDNVNLINLWTFDASKSFLNKVLLILTLPIVTLQFLLAILKYDFINVRNSGFYSIILGILVRVFKIPSITKWAGSYRTFKGESFITKIDRKIINWNSKKHKVLIYDSVKKEQFVNFIPALMSNSEIDVAKKISIAKPNINERLEIVSIGRLYWAKNFELTIEALGALKKDSTVSFDWHLHLIGDGVLRVKLEKMCIDLGIEKMVTFYGGLPFNEAQNVLAKSHVLIMPGVMEGWPKPIAEAWAHNCLPIASNKGNVPDIINTEQKGVCFEPIDKDLMLAIKNAYLYLTSKTKNLDFTKFVKSYSLEEFQKRLIDVIKLVK